MTQRKIPLRRCNGCGESKPKKELVRVVRAQDGTVSLDLTGKKPGRGAYVCPSAASRRASSACRRSPPINPKVFFIRLAPLVVWYGAKGRRVIVFCSRPW